MTTPDVSGPAAAFNEQPGQPPLPKRPDAPTAPSADSPRTASTPSGARLGLALLTVLLVTAGLHFFRLGSWPWDNDEVHSLIELGVRDRGATFISQAQLDKLPRLVPIWYGIQGFVLRAFPANEWGARALSVSCGVLAVAVAFYLAARRFGLLYAIGLAILLNGAQYYVWLSQQNRFYTMALLFFTLTAGAIWCPTAGIRMAILSGALAAAAVLCHNLLVVVFGLGFACACLGYLLGQVPRTVLARCGVTALVSVALYFGHLRPVMGNWVSGGTGGTHPLVSFAAHAGIPTLALALFGACACLTYSEGRKAMTWWVLLAVSGMLFTAASPLLLSSWHPRYGLLFMPPVWVVAAFGMAEIARRIAARPLVVAWYACVALLLLPKLASHYQDGSRHDFRTAARLVIDASSASEPVFCTWPETLEYYLPPHLAARTKSWRRGQELPPSECLIVHSSNAWEPVLTFPGRPVEVIGEVCRRRFDEQSHFIRVYRVGASP